MIINVFGECDRRPVLYTLMKICQTLGDVLVVSDDVSILRLSDTKESGGHYQNTMIAFAKEGLDDYMASSEYTYSDFDFTLVDGMLCAEADIYILVNGLATSENLSLAMECVEDYITIQLFGKGYIQKDTMLYMEQFEALGTMCPISAKLAQDLSKLLSTKLKVDAKTLLTAATSNQFARTEKPRHFRKGKQ